MTGALAPIVATLPTPAATPGRALAEISLRDVSKSYLASGGETRTVLAHVNLAIEPGEFVVILGETGCGKSTLLRLILGEELPSSGTVEVAGKPVRQIDARCGYVPQRYSLFPNLTALDNVMFGPRTARYHLTGWLHPGYWRFRRELRERAMEQLLRMGLKQADAGKYPHRMSGGMQQRLAIAQALVMHPSVLLLDEAFSALDPSTRISLQELLLGIWREQHPTLVFVTHNVAEALFLGTRLIVLAPYAEGMGTNVIADMPLTRSDLPFLERRHTREFMEQLAYVEELSYGLRQAAGAQPYPDNEKQSGT
jgi:NitT/TauT family transport system ATP-binding protein